MGACVLCHRFTSASGRQASNRVIGDRPCSAAASPTMQSGRKRSVAATPKARRAAFPRPSLERRAAAPRWNSERQREQRPGDRPRVRRARGHVQGVRAGVRSHAPATDARKQHGQLRGCGAAGDDARQEVTGSVARAAPNEADHDPLRDEHAVCQTEVFRLFLVVGNPQGRGDRTEIRSCGDRPLTSLYDVEISGGNRSASEEGTGTAPERSGEL